MLSAMVGADGRRDASNRSASRMARSASMSSASSSRAREGGVRRGVVVADPGQELAEALLALRGLLQVDELRHVARGEPVLVLEAGDLVARRDPAVVLPVDADEDVALLQVGAVELLRRMRPSTELEHDRREVQPLDRGARGSALGLELLQGRADEDPEPLVGRADRESGGAVDHGDAVDVARAPVRRGSMEQLWAASPRPSSTRTGDDANHSGWDAAVSSAAPHPWAQPATRTTRPPPSVVPAEFSSSTV